MYADKQDLNANEDGIGILACTDVRILDLAVKKKELLLMHNSKERLWIDSARSCCQSIMGLLTPGGGIMPGRGGPPWKKGGGGPPCMGGREPGGITPGGGPPGRGGPPGKNGGGGPPGRGAAARGPPAQRYSDKEI